MNALFIHETESTVRLILNADKCNGCERCISACQDGLLAFEPASEMNHQLAIVLLSSERVPCTSCGAPTVSRAEINYMTQKIGHPVWLEMCLTCRASAPHGGYK